MVKVSYICKECGSIINNNDYGCSQRGGTDGCVIGFGCLFEIVLIIAGFYVWLCWIVALILFFIQSIYSSSNKTYRQCPKCGAKDSLIPSNTPVAQKMIQENGLEEKQKEAIQEDIEAHKKWKKIRIKGLIILIILFLLWGLLLYFSLK